MSETKERSAETQDGRRPERGPVGGGGEPRNGPRPPATEGVAARGLGSTTRWPSPWGGPRPGGSGGGSRAGRKAVMEYGMPVGMATLRPAKWAAAMITNQSHKLHTHKKTYEVWSGGCDIHLDLDPTPVPAWVGLTGMIGGGLSA